MSETLSECVSETLLELPSDRKSVSLMPLSGEASVYLWVPYFPAKINKG
jgi:hypothetical protein